MYIYKYVSDFNSGGLANGVIVVDATTKHNPTEGD